MYITSSCSLISVQAGHCFCTIRDWQSCGTIQWHQPAYCAILILPGGVLSWVSFGWLCLWSHLHNELNCVSSTCPFSPWYAVCSTSSLFDCNISSGSYALSYPVSYCLIVSHIDFGLLYCFWCKEGCKGCKWRGQTGWCAFCRLGWVVVVGFVHKRWKHAISQEHGEKMLCLLICSGSWWMCVWAVLVCRVGLDECLWICVWNL